MNEQENQALIERCKREIDALKRCVTIYPDAPVFRSDLLIHEIALASLTAPPVKLPDPKHCPAEYHGSLLWHESEAVNKTISECAAAIRAAGYQVEGE